MKFLNSSKQFIFLEGKGRGISLKDLFLLEVAKGDLKLFKSFVDFDLCGPSTNLHKRCLVGYTTESGVIKSHLQSLHSISHHPQALMHAIVETDKLRVILVALASDGTTHKLGLEFDPRQKLIIGVVYQVNGSYVRTHPRPDPEKSRKTM